jgi:hypothetical protein
MDSSGDSSGKSIAYYEDADAVRARDDAQRGDGITRSPMPPVKLLTRRGSRTGTTGSWYYRYRYYCYYY